MGALASFWTFAAFLAADRPRRGSVVHRSPPQPVPPPRPFCARTSESSHLESSNLKRIVYHVWFWLLNWVAALKPKALERVNWLMPPTRATTGPRPYAPRIWTMTFRLRGPSNSQKKIPCQVPSVRDWSLTRICSLQPTRELLQWASELPSECR